MSPTDGLARCPWGVDPPEYRRYHDEEWGRPVVDDTRLFEKLCLEGFQAGLSWLTILRKRDAAIVRHRGKIEATIANARALLDFQRHGPLAGLVWRHEPPERPAPRSLADVPSATPESVALSRDLRRRGFRFVGPTTAYAAMQSLGVVDDHLADCHVRLAVEAERAVLPRPRDI